MPMSRPSPSISQIFKSTPILHHISCLLAEIHWYHFKWAQNITVICSGSNVRCLVSSTSITCLVTKPAHQMLCTAKSAQLCTNVYFCILQTYFSLLHSPVLSAYFSSNKICVAALHVLSPNWITNALLCTTLYTILYSFKLTAVYSLAKLSSLVYMRRATGCKWEKAKSNNDSKSQITAK